MAHNATKANDALATALPLVANAFTDAELTPLAIVINVVFGDQDHQWAVGSVRPNVPVDISHLLAASLTESSEEVRETHGHGPL